MSRKPPRRKPPPPLNGFASETPGDTPQFLPQSPGNTRNYLEPHYDSLSRLSGSLSLPTTPYDGDPRFQEPLPGYGNKLLLPFYSSERANEYENFERQEPFLRSKPLPTIGVPDSLSYDPDETAGSSFYPDDLSPTFADLLQSCDTPRPKGPQDLPQDYAFLAETAINLRQDEDHAPSYAEKPLGRSSLRKYSASRKFQNLLLGGTSPSGLLDSGDSLDFTNDDEIIDFARDLMLETTRTNSKWGENTYVSKTADLPYPRDPVELDLGPWTTPTRIPTLGARNLKNSNSGSPINLTPNLLLSTHPYAAFPPSPELPLGPRSLLNSPTKGSINRSPRNDYATHVSESRSSRSPSPRKYMGSPMTKSPTKSSPFYPVEEDYLNVLDSYYEESRMPRWSLIEHDDFELYYDDSFISPRDEQFDYSILPELPLRASDVVPLDLYRGSNVLLQPTSTIRRKNDDLPPVPLSLPLLPFSSVTLSNLHFEACPNVWSLKNIFEWCIKLTSWMHSNTIQQKELKKSLIKLIAYRKPDIPVDLINRNVGRIIESFKSSGVLVPKDTELEFVISWKISGVLVDLTDCYSFDHHKGQKDFSQKCYSYLCPINKLVEHEKLMKVTDINELELGSDWASHWKLTAQDMTIDISESKRQSFLFDLIKFEQTFIQRAKCFIEVAGPEFIRQAKIVLGNPHATAMKEFEQSIFDSSERLCSIHQKTLFEPLLRILVSDGKFIKSISDLARLYTNWSREAKKPLLAYMSSMPMIQDLLNNPALKTWDQTIRSNPNIKELQVNGSLLLMSTFNSRYQQLPLQLMDVRKFFDEGDEEYTTLTEAIDSIRGLGSKVNEMKVYADNIHSLQAVQRQLTWKSNVTQPNLHLNSKNRKLFYRGDLIRKGELKINSSHVHMIVLDNYVLLTDKQRSQKSVVMKVSETPIPVDYLIVENREKEAIGLGKTSAQSSIDEAAEEVSSFPFKIRYAGRGKSESHTLVAATENDRQKWISTLQQTKLNATKRSMLSAPYNFKLTDNSFFAYEQTLSKFPILPANDPIYLLAKEKSLSATTTFINRQVQCSEMFTFMNGQFHFLGTSAGVYCCDEKNIWKKIINMNNVTRITVVPELNVALVLANKMLRYYPLQLLINLYYEKKEHLTSYQISNESILFYEFGQHLGLPTLIVAKRKNAGSTTFKIFVLQEDNNGILSTIEVVKKFYIQAECYGISIFNTSLAVHTQRGFEILDLQKLSPRTVPEFPSSDSQSKKLDGYSRKKLAQTPDLIKKVISHATPLGMFKLSNNKEFLLVFSECAIFVNRAGKLSRTSMVRFDYRPKDIAFADNNLILVCEEVIEIWSISDSTTGVNKLAQVIPNKDIRLLNAESLSFRVVNPIKPDKQLIFRLLKKIGPA